MIQINNIIPIMSLKMHVFNVKFTFKSLEANCQRSSCKVHIFIKIQNQQRKLKQVAEVKKNTAIFNSEFNWEEVPIKYDQISGTYFDTPAILSIHYETSQQGLKSNKLKVGQVTVNLAKLLNTKTYRINTNYNIQKCYDPNAKLKMGIDLTQVNYNQSVHNRGQQLDAGENYKNIKNSSIWKVSKIREKMNEDQKGMLQNKLYEYEDKLQKYRQSNNDQIKRFNQQLERKQQKISSLSTQNISLTQAVQNSQVQLQKCKTKSSMLQKQLVSCQQSMRALNSTKQSHNRQIISLRQQNEELKLRIEQIEQAKDKKEHHYKQQLDKYTQKYMESQNGRNRTIFELEKRLDEEIKKKDDHYAEIVSKLQFKLQNTGQSYRETSTRKQKQLVVVIEKCQKLQKQRYSLENALKQQQQTNAQLENRVMQVNQYNQKLMAQIKSVQSQAELSAFSVSNLQKQLQKAKLQLRSQAKTIEEVKYEIELANKTIQQQQAMISKLNRSIKMLQQRGYYMEQKYQDELQIKSYNEQCIKGSNNYYKNELKKQQVKNKLLEEKISDSESSLQAIQKQKQKFQEEIKNLNKLVFQNGYQILRLQNENKALSQKTQQLQMEVNNKQLSHKDLQRKVDLAIAQNNQEISEYINTINQLEAKIKEISQKRLEDANSWQLQFNKQSIDKNNMLSYLESELERLKIMEKSLRANLNDKNQKQIQLEASIHQQRQKNRTLERENTKIKHQITKINDERQLLTKQTQKDRTKITELKNELFSTKQQKQKQQRRISKQKQSYTQLIKWIIDRNWNSMGTDRQFVQQASPQVQLQLITYVNNGLDRLYRLWEKNTKLVEELKDQNEKLSQQMIRNKLQTQYEQQFTLKFNQLNSVQLEKDEWPERIQKKYSSHIPNPIVDISQSFQITKLEQLKIINSQLQRDITLRNAEIQALNEELFQQKTKIREITQENKNLSQQVQDLNITLVKKNTLINSLQAQISDRDMDSSFLPSNYVGPKSPSRSSDFKSIIESKFREEKQIKEFESKIEELNKQNSIKKSKIDLLENRIKISNQKLAVQSQRVVNLQRNLKQKQQSIRKMGKQLEQKQDKNDKAVKQLEIVSNKLNKKESVIEELKNQVKQLNKLTQQLRRQAEQKDRKLKQRQTEIQKIMKQRQYQTLDSNQKMSMERIEKQKLILEQKLQINSMQTVIKQNQKRVSSLQNMIKKLKEQNERLYQKNIKFISDNNMLEEQIKDAKYNEKVMKESYQKTCAQFQQKLQSKQFEFQEYKFSTQSKIMDLEKKIQDNTITRI